MTCPSSSPNFLGRGRGPSFSGSPVKYPSTGCRRPSALSLVTTCVRARACACACAFVAMGKESWTLGGCTRNGKRDGRVGRSRRKSGAECQPHGHSDGAWVGNTAHYPRASGRYRRETCLFVLAELGSAVAAWSLWMKPDWTPQHGALCFSVPRPSAAECVDSYPPDVRMHVRFLEHVAVAGEQFNGVRVRFLVRFHSTGHRLKEDRSATKVGCPITTTLQEMPNIKLRQCT